MDDYELTRLTRDFHKAMLGVYQSALVECGYRAPRFKQMVDAQGGLVTAKKLLAAAGVSEGLEHLWELKRLDISMEALVLREPWTRLFSDSELSIARSKLKAMGYQG